MENLGYIDQLGRGLPMVYQEAVSSGKKVVFEEIGEEFKVMLEVWAFSFEFLPLSRKQEIIRQYLS